MFVVVANHIYIEYCKTSLDVNAVNSKGFTESFLKLIFNIIVIIVFNIKLVFFVRQCHRAQDVFCKTELRRNDILCT